METAGRPAAGRSRMRTFVQVLGGVVLGIGVAALMELQPGALFALYALGLGAALLCLGLLMPDQSVERPQREDQNWM